MRIEEFLARHGLTCNPFANAEEAQGDEVLLNLLRRQDFQFNHPQWPKFLGEPPGSQTSVVFGLKGSGKTAMRLALGEAIESFNQRNRDGRVLLATYDEFNGYLDAWKAHVEQEMAGRRTWWQRLLGRPGPAASLREHWRLAGHMDAILSETAGLLERLLADSPEGPRRWDPHVKYDALLLAAYYLPGQSHEYRRTLAVLHKRLFSGASRVGWALLGLLATVLTLGTIHLYRWFRLQALANRLGRRIQVIRRDPADRRKALGYIPLAHLRNQPLLAKVADPNDETARYDLLAKLVGVARAAGYARIIVVIDKVDEPSMIHGDYERMADFIRPLWNNKILQTSGVQFKMLLPAQLHQVIRKADSQLLNAARLDKANMIYPLTWTGRHLYEMLCERATACKAQADGEPFDLQSLFDPQVERDELVAELDRLRIPRYAAKLMNRAIAAACQSILAQDLDGAKPLIAGRVFQQASAQIETEMRNETQDLQEI